MLQFCLWPISQQHASPYPDEPGSQHPRHPIGSLRSHSRVHRASPKTPAVFSGGIRHRPVWEPHPDRKSRASHAVHIFLCRHNDGPLRHIPAPVCGVHSHGACPNVQFPSNIAILQFCFLLWVQYIVIVPSALLYRIYYFMGFIKLVQFVIINIIIYMFFLLCGDWKF